MGEVMGRKGGGGGGKVEEINKMSFLASTIPGHMWPLKKCADEKINKNK